MKYAVAAVIVLSAAFPALAGPATGDTFHTRNSADLREAIVRDWQKANINLRIL